MMILMTKVSRQVRRHVGEIKKEVVKQMLALATSGFGLVAALAWNEVIKELVEGYIKPLVGSSSGIISLLIYAVVITILAVVITYDLTRIVKKS
jgi:hypothetical protein